MLGSLRRSRRLALFLLVLSPAMAGTALPVLHPCPVDGPGAMSRTAHVGHHGKAAPTDRSSAGENSHCCTCIGCSLGSPAAKSSGPAISQRATPEVAGPRWSGQDATLCLAPLATLLPPATAPPLL